MVQRSDTARRIDLDRRQSGAIGDPAGEQARLERLRLAPFAETGEAGIDVGVAVQREDGFGVEQVQRAPQRSGRLHRPIFVRDHDVASRLQ